MSLAFPLALVDISLSATRKRGTKASQVAVVRERSGALLSKAGNGTGGTRDLFVSCSSLVVAFPVHMQRILKRGQLIRCTEDQLTLKVSPCRRVRSIDRTLFMGYLLRHHLIKSKQ